MTQTFDFVVGCLDVDIGNQQHIYLEAHFNGVDVLALFIQEEGGDVDRHLAMHRHRAFFHRLFLNDAQHVQC